MKSGKHDKAKRSTSKRSQGAATNVAKWLWPTILLVTAVIGAIAFSRLTHRENSDPKAPAAIAEHPGAFAGAATPPAFNPNDLPDKADDLVSFGNAQMEAGNFDIAVLAFEKTVKINPDDETDRFNL